MKISIMTEIINSLLNDNDSNISFINFFPLEVIIPVHQKKTVETRLSAAIASPMSGDNE